MGSAREPALAERFALYRDLIALRHAHEALREGGLRFVHAGEHSIAYVRETEAESVLVVAAKEADEVDIPAGALLARDAEPLFGDVVLSAGEAGAVRIAVRGPSFAVWRLAGVTVPERVVDAETGPKTHRDAAWR